MTISFRTAALTVLFGMAAVPAGLAAQARGDIIVTPYAAVYAPTTDIAALSASQGGAGARMTLKQKTGLALGANASYWMTERFGFEVGGSYAWSDASASGSVWDTGTDFDASVSENAYVIFGSAKVMYQVLPPTSRNNLRIGVGPAIIRRGGSAYASDADGEFAGLTDVGGAVSLCSRFALTNRLGLRIRAESYLYEAQLKFKDPMDPTSSFQFDSRFQTDLLFSAGLQFALGR